MKDYVAYIDTDSLAFYLKQWFIDQGVSQEKWDSLNKKTQLDYIKRVSSIVEKYVNEKSYEITQKIHYNSPVEHTKITYEIEKIATSALFATKKRYSMLLISDDLSEDILVKGMEIIRSDSPEIVKPKIKYLLEMLLKNYPDDDIQEYIKKTKKELKVCSPSEISENKSVNNLDKYIKEEYKAIKGTPHHVKGVANLRFLIRQLNLVDEVEVPGEGVKAKVVYLKPNKYKIDCLSFLSWHKKFNEAIQIDMNKMIENNFTKKIKSLLEISNKEYLVEEKLDVEDLFS